MPATTDGTKFSHRLGSADTALVDKLRDQLAAGKFDRMLGGKKDRAAVEAFYSSRDFAPLWIADGAMSDRAKAAAAYLAGVDADGLEPSEYPVPQIKAGMEPEALAEAEIKFTDAVLTFARHAMSGRVHYSRVSADIIYDLAKPDPANVLARSPRRRTRPQRSTASIRRSRSTRRSRPSSPKCATAPADVDKPMIRPGTGAEVRQGQEGQEQVLMEDPRVPALRKRFSLKAPDGDTSSTTRRCPTRSPSSRRSTASAPTASSAQATLDADQRTASARRPSTSSSPTWSAGAGCRATSARPT